MCALWTPNTVCRNVIVAVDFIYPNKGWPTLCLHTWEHVVTLRGELDEPLSVLSTPYLYLTVTTKRMYTQSSNVHVLDLNRNPCYSPLHHVPGYALDPRLSTSCTHLMLLNTWFSNLEIRNVFYLPINRFRLKNFTKVIPAVQVRLCVVVVDFKRETTECNGKVHAQTSYQLRPEYISRSFNLKRKVN